jgi:tRNA 2-thiouridine synthesizing protein A
MNDDTHIDARGLLCPLPVLKLRKRLQSVPHGSVLKLMTTDPAAVIDVPHFCMESGNVLLESSTDEDVTTYSVKKS